MKGKIKLLGHIGLALFLVSALMLVLAPVAQAAAVTSVWLEFPGDMSATYEACTYTALNNDADFNKTSANSNLIVHFTAATALKANIDTITIYFPDGSTELSGASNSGGTFSITAGTVARGSQLICVDPDGAGSTYGYYDITTAATLAGYRLKLTTPIDIAAGASPYIYIATNSNIDLSSVEGSNYKIKMQTSKDTTLVLSPTFSLGATDNHVTIDTGGTAVYVPLTTVAGSATQFTFGFNTVNALTAGSNTIAVIFPSGTSVPTSIAADQIECQYYTSTVTTGTGASGYQQVSGTVTVNSDARMVTITSPVSVTAAKGCQVRFKTGAGVTMPQAITVAYEATTQHAYLGYYIYTSADRLMQKGTGGGAATGNFKISAGAAAKLAFNNDSYLGLYGSASYSADCAIINGFTLALYLELQDQYGNRIYDGTGYSSTVNFSATAGSLYTNVVTTASTTSSPLTNGAKTLYFRATSDGTHTITASSGTYTDGTWQVTVAPAVSLYDANSNLVNTFAPLSTNEEPTLKGGYYVNEAIIAAMEGDTIKLGNGIYDVTSNVLTVDKAVTIEAVSGTTPVLRCIDTPSSARVSLSKGATFNGLTFRGLRWTTQLGAGFIDYYPTSATGATIQNCTFEDFIVKMGAIWVVELGGSTVVALTSGTITNNTFRNILGDVDDCATVVTLQASTTSLSGVTISNNTFTNNACMAITVTGSGGGTGRSITGITISGNTISSNRAFEVGIDICNWASAGVTVALGSSASPIKVINNEISGCLDSAIRLEDGTGAAVAFSIAFPGVRIKRNYIHDNAGPGIEIETHSAATGSTTAAIASALEIMYNDIVSCAHTSGTYGIYNNLYDKSTSAQITAQYNWFGVATGPTVTSNVGGTGDTVSTYVIYSPWLYKSRTDVVADNVAYGAARMNLVSGWNTLSTPVKLIEAADAIDELIPSGMTIAYYYDATGWHQIIGTYVLNPCNAVYVKMSTTASPLLKFDAGAFSAPSKSLAAGWNLISLASLSSSGKKDAPAVASVALTAAGLPGYSQVVSPSMNASQTDLFGNSGSGWAYSYGETTGGGTNYMYAGLGYWIYMQNAATLAGFEITPIAPDLD
jgi:hypothetical protein